MTREAGFLEGDRHILFYGIKSVVESVKLKDTSDCTSKCVQPES